MRELSFVGLSDDGSSLVLSSTDGTRYSVPCDERLEAAVRRDRSRLGQLEIALDGTSPKDIQQRIRHGQTPEDIAASSGLAIERVLRFAGPVLAERAHLADQARATELRGGAHVRTLDHAVTTELAAGGVDVELLEWDAWRREDGRWSLLVSWDPVDEVATGATAALWIYDPLGRTLVPDDPAAAWLLGDRPEPEDVAGSDGYDTGDTYDTVPVAAEHRPHLVGLPAPESETTDESAWHAESGDITWDDDAVDPDAAFTAIVERDSGARVVDLADRPPAEPADDAPLDDLYDTLPGLARPEKQGRRARRKAKDGTSSGSGDAAKGTKQRASVPSWDEILFGRSPDS
jgi:hypothetical protein